MRFTRRYNYYRSFCGRCEAFYYALLNLEG